MTEINGPRSKDIPGTTKFGEYLLSRNALYNYGFEKWVFDPGMLFDSHIKWWGSKGIRNKPHEGLDICLYITGDGEIRFLGERTRIPAIYKGEVVNIINDFLGKSVFMKHNIYNRYRKQLLTIYGHLIPQEGLLPGNVLQEGDLIGTISGDRNKNIPPHVHISFAWISTPFKNEVLNWEYLSDTRKVSLLDPMIIIDFHHLIKCYQI